MRDEVEVGGGDMIEERDKGEVVEDIGERAEERALKAMWRHDFLKLAQREGRRRNRQPLTTRRVLLFELGIGFHG